MRFVTKAIKSSYFRLFSMVHLQSGKRECIQGVQHCKHSLQYAVYRIQPSIQSRLNFTSTGTCMHCVKKCHYFSVYMSRVPDGVYSTYLHTSLQISIT